MTQAVKTNAGASFPSMFPVRSELDAGYAFFSNEHVTPEKVLASHVAHTVERCEKNGQVLVIHDGTEFQFTGDRDGVGPLGGGRGFLGQFSIALSGASDRDILGVLGVHLWARQDKIKRKRKPTYAELYAREDKESLVWMDNIRACEHALGGSARAIHVMDSGADDYAQFAQLDALGVMGVVRLKHNRVLPEGRLHDVVESAPIIVQREVRVSARKHPDPAPKQAKTHPDRDARLATLHVTAVTVTIQRPHTADPLFQPSVALQVVRVFEPNPPLGEHPVEWLLGTNLPINSVADLLHIVDIYRARWVVEEYFKALKSGCRIQARQLETGHALMNMVAFFAPIAAKLLALRDTARHDPHRKASTIMDPTEIKVLRTLSRAPLSTNPTVGEVYLAIAKLAGHQKSNGEPGWSLLAQGALELARAVNYQRLLDAQQ